MRKLKTNKISAKKMLKQEPNLYKYNQILLILLGTYKKIFNITNNNIADFLENKKHLNLNCDYINNYWFPGIEGIIKRFIRYAERFNRSIPNKIIGNNNLNIAVTNEITKVKIELIRIWTLDANPSKSDIEILKMLSCHILINRYIYRGLMNEHLNKNQIREIKLLLGLGKKPLGNILEEMADSKVIDEIKKENYYEKNEI